MADSLAKKAADKVEARMLPLKVTVPATSVLRRISIPRDKLTYISFITAVQELLKVKDASILKLEMNDEQNPHIINDGEALRKALQFFDTSGGACMHLVARISDRTDVKFSSVGISVRI